jgi:hypothetical protein
MGNKTTSTVYLDEDDVREFREKGFNISETARIAMRTILETGFDDIATMLRVSAIDRELTSLEGDLNTLNKHKYLLIYKQKELTETRDNLVINMKAIQTSNRISELTQVLNKHIIDSKFDSESIASEFPDIIIELEQLNSNFNIVTHIERLKIILDF